MADAVGKRSGSRGVTLPANLPWLERLFQIWPPGGGIRTEPQAWQQVSSEVTEAWKACLLETKERAGGSMGFGWSTLWHPCLRVFAGVGGWREGLSIVTLPFAFFRW